MTKFVVRICLLFLFLITGTTSFAQKKADSKSSGKKGVAENQKDDLGRKQGNWKYENRLGMLIMEIQYKNDKRDGSTKVYYLTQEGTKMREMTQYQDGIREGEYKRYFFSGEVNIEGNYSQGRKDGKWTKYQEDGTVRWEGEYKKGVKDGEWKFNNRKGELIVAIQYKDGVDVKAAAEAAKQADDKKAADKKKLDKLGVPPSKNKPAQGSPGPSGAKKN